MTAVVICHPNADPERVWPGQAPLDQTGLMLAVRMLDDLENEDDGEIRASDYACLEDWPREGKPFQNVVLKQLRRAQAAGPAAESAFCAVLSDFVAFSCGGMSPNCARYIALYALRKPRT
jgi:hypothetical protein